LIVVDASAVLELLLNSPVGLRVASRLFDNDESLHAPHLLDLEVTQVLRRYVSARELTVARAAAALEDFIDLPISRHEHAALLPRIWQLRSSLSAYDAAYVCLAETLDAPLLTCDVKMRNSHGHAVQIEVA
jgi:predicted nucleic acid-binding protein